MFTKTSLSHFLRLLLALAVDLSSFLFCCSYLDVNNQFSSIGRIGLQPGKKKKRTTLIKISCWKRLLSRRFGSWIHANLMHGNDVQQPPMWRVNWKMIRFRFCFRHVVIGILWLVHFLKAHTELTMAILISAAIVSARLMDFGFRKMWVLISFNSLLF